MIERSPERPVISDGRTSIGAGLRASWRSAEQQPKPFSHGGVREGSIAQYRIWQFPHHRSLYDRKDLARVWAYGRESEDFVAVVADERLHKPACFG